jgi:hypothetical protein
MQCCTCGAPAKSLTPGDFDGVIVACGHCGTYEVHGPVLNDLLRLTLQERKDVLDRAKERQETDARPSIKRVHLSP